MNLSAPAVRFSSRPSAAGRQRLLAHWGEPLFVADWERTLMMHFRVDARTLQRHVPFALDLWDGHAYLSLVAFTMRGMRPFIGGNWTAWMFRPIATHEFLNVRTYVRHGDEPGIHFLAEWLSNRLAVALGPRTFGLPYRHGRIRYEHDWNDGELRGRVVDVTNGTALAYRAEAEFDAATFEPCAEGTLDEWLMERYTAFNAGSGCQKYFRIWHPPWPQQPVNVELLDTSLLTRAWPWFAEAEFVGANFSPGVRDVWMGRPHRVQ